MTQPIDTDELPEWDDDPKWNDPIVSILSEHQRLPWSSLEFSHCMCGWQHEDGPGYWRLHVAGLIRAALSASPAGERAMHEGWTAEAEVYIAEDGHPALRVVGAAAGERDTIEAGEPPTYFGSETAP